ncbi:MAG TPA: hypothetical protein VD997_10255 [Phycisphaerales bacterium]|nr:hypothetical protein [Phycisphaerales bacterium]
MECPSCTFQNTPGTRSCVRCQSLLDFSGVAVVPPRAHGPAALRAASASADVLGFRLRDALRRVREGSPIRIDADVSWGAAVCSIVPGLGHVIIGRRRTGLAIFLVWLALLVACLLNYGTSFAFVCATSAVGLHCAAVCTLLSQTLQHETVGFRAFVGLGVYLVLCGVLYGPAYWMATRLVGAVPVVGVRAAGGIKQDDLLIHTGPWLQTTYERGDFVVYRVRQGWSSGVILQEGLLFDRVLGLPGDTVVVHGREVHVNGVLQPYTPMSFWPGRTELTAGPDDYIIVPSLLNAPGQGQFGGVLTPVIERMSHVPSGDVLGRVVWRVGDGLDFGPVPDSSAQVEGEAP